MFGESGGLAFGVSNPLQYAPTRSGRDSDAIIASITKEKSSNLFT